jgi:hypothetical protein
VNPSQITNFQVQSADPDSLNTLSGSVTQAATAAQLTYTGGFGGRIAANASFTLTGSLGSANFSVTFLETLTAVRDRINLQTTTTGVTASVSGNNLFLTSTGVGTAATVSRVVTSGTFNVTGGNGNGTANGTNAVLQINSQPVVASGNNVSYSDALGSYTFTLVNGFSGAFNPITVTSANGTFNITGGNGNGADTGSDAAAVFNGQPATASGNVFTINTGGGQFVLELSDGFSGALDPIVITSSLADFTISGGNGDATANGLDAEATINGLNLTSAGRVFTLPTAGGNLIISFQNAFLGAFDPFTVAVREQSIPSLNGGAPARSSGRAAKAIINGRTVKQKDGRFLINQDGVEIAIKFARGFRGKFDDITVSAAGDDSETATTMLGKADAARVRSFIEPLLSLASGGTNSDLSQNGGRAFRLAASALSELTTLRAGNSATNRRSLTSGTLLDQLA